ncbi:MAG TPA: SCO family protein [Thermoanaerobaculia bacterium]|nr:SCO family protein [Thermoanaerobaculia bacterium]
MNHAAPFALLLCLAAAPYPVLAQDPHEHHHHPAEATPAAPQSDADRTEAAPGLKIPDVSLVDQDGRPVHFYSDLIQGRVVAVNFIFTSCTTICPPMGATFGQVQKLLGDRAGRDVRLISVSVDPATDTPERMKAWGQRFGAGPGWTLVTGSRDEVTRLLKALGAYTPSINDHSPLVLIGNDARGDWTRAYGLAAPAKLVELIDAAAPAAKAAQAEPAGSPAQSYFGDVPLIDQDGREQRLYSDLMKGKTVVIDVMFTECTGVCPLLSQKMEKIQAALGDRVGKDVHLLSISVDPKNDNPTRLKEYAARYHAKPGWYFLTGSKENIDEALRKLGQYVEQREAHQNLILIGNDRTGLWKKAMGLADPAELIPVVESVVNDKG